MRINIKEKKYHCYRKKCKNNESIFNKTFFSNCKIPLQDLMLLTYLYLNKVPVECIKLMTGIQSEAVTNWTGFLRQLLGETVEETDTTIGGQEVEVEIDETKLVKRKYERGHMVEEVWVVAGVERTPEKRMFVLEVDGRNKENIKDIIASHVYPGFIVLTDCWKPYKGAWKELNLEHKIVNHSKNFKNPEDGTHTNTIEGQNNALKILIRPRNRNKKNIKYFLLYFLRRRIHKKNIFKGFIKALKLIKY